LDIVEASKASIKGRGLRVALPEGEDERILRAAQRLSEAGLARPVIMGKAGEVRARAEALGVRLEGCEVRDPASDGALTRQQRDRGRGRGLLGGANRGLLDRTNLAGVKTGQNKMGRLDGVAAAQPPHRHQQHLPGL